MVPHDSQQHNSHIMYPNGVIEMNAMPSQQGLSSESYSFSRQFGQGQLGN